MENVYQNASGWTDEYERLKKILNDENRLRKEKSEIMKLQPWYKRPGNILGIIAIIVSILLFILNIFISQQKKEISVSYTKPSTLVFFTSSLKPKSKIMFDGKQVEDLWRSVLYIKNSGSKAIDREDFKDGPLTFKISNGEMNSFANKDSLNLPFLLDVVSKSSAGQRQAIINIKERRFSGVFEYLPTIMNPDEFVELEIYTSIPLDYDITLDGKIFEGTINPILKVPEIVTSSPKLGVRELIFTGLHQLFGARWITIVFFIAGLLALVYLSFVSFVNAQDNDWVLPLFSAFVISLCLTIINLVALIYSTIT